MNSFKYNCEKCKFVTNTLNNYNIHLSTKKHTNPEIIECKFECIICNKKYKGHSGLWRHKRLCKESPSEQNTLVKKNEEINTLVKKNEEQNQELNELKAQIIEMSKNQVVSVTNNQVTNNPVTNLNINFFLNEQCKNAINLIDFVKSIVFELKDFEKIQDNGYIENKTNKILESLNKLTVYERPLHYIKNEEDEKEIHIRDENVWKKETDANKPILDKAMNKLNNKEYKELYESVKEEAVSARGRKQTFWNVDKIPNFHELKDIMTTDNPDDKDKLISRILDNVVYP